MLIDAHSHLHVKEFDADRDEVIARARKANVDFIAVGFSPEGNEASAALAAKYGAYWTAGIHPHHSDLATKENLRRIEELKKSPAGKSLVALGEFGLDYFKNFQPVPLQQDAFRRQLELAQKLNLPIIIHCRDAFGDALKILDEEKITRALFHCFAGTEAEAAECWKRGYYTSFTGICTYPNAQNVRQVLAKAPLEKILIETDCPFLPPVPHRGKRNEPLFLRDTFNFIADFLKIAPAELEKILYQNTTKFFGLQIKN